MTDRAKGKADAARRAQLIDLVNKAVDGKADELLAGGKDGSIYDALLDEVKMAGWRTRRRSLTA